MFQKTLTALLLLILSPSLFCYEGTDRIIWKKIPIKLALNVGEERVIFFSQNVDLWEPDLAKNVIIANTVGNVLYIKSVKEMPELRYRVKKENGEVILLDFTSKKDIKLPNKVYVADKDTVKKEGGSDVKFNREDAVQDQDIKVALVRYASQRLYGSQRRVENNIKVQRQKLPVGAIVPLVIGGDVISEILAGWKAGDTYVTAIRLINITRSENTIDPFYHLRGKWIAASFQHSSTLGAKGSKEGVTTLYLVSDSNFYESLNAEVAYGH